MTATRSRTADRSTVSRSVRLHPRRSAARIARRLVRDACAGSRLPDELVDDAVRVAGELVRGSARRARLDLDLVVELDDRTLTVRVHDDLGTLTPAPSRRSRKGARRGQDLVAGLSTSWGYFRCGSASETWASFRAQPEYVTIRLRPEYVAI
jgi:hypothetical protein